MKNHILRWGVLLAIGFGIGSAIGYFQSMNETITSETSESNGNATIIKKPRKIADQFKNIGGEFSLINHEGQAVTQDTYAGTYKLIFFGFTFCPAVCPTELQKITLIMGDLEELSDQITPLFISIDPERDSPEVMKKYVEQFHPKLIGLTGSVEQIDAIKKSFHVYASKVENDMMDEYMMDHSSFMYLTDHNNKLIGIYPAKDDAIDIAQEIRELIAK